ncbi:hypothetical protein As57867_024568, partial [Aphanomyces stellatus]
MVEVSLNCMVVGGGTPFSIDIDAGKKVDHLKKKIKKEKEYKFPADELQLYLVDGLAQDKDEQIVYKGITIDMPNCSLVDFGSSTKKLAALSLISECFEEADVNIRWKIHVLVVIPEGVASTLSPSVEFSRGFIACKIGFYNDIVNADVKDGWLYFNQTIPSSAAKPEALLVRASYQTIASSIQDRGKDGIFKTIITGTPGIGKSLFLIYLLWNLVKAGKKVLFIYHPNLIYYNGLGGVFELREFPSAIEHSFWDESLWCLFDAKGKNERHLSAIPYDNCKVVVSTSPRRDMINDFKKPPTPKIFYMPLWTEHELEQVASTFPQVVDWRDRFNILGGVPRT